MQKLNENNKIKSILYQTDKLLQNTVITILNEMLDYEDNFFVDKMEEDYKIKKDEVTFIIETKGLSRNIKGEDISKTSNHVEIYLDELDEKNITENVKGIYIVATQRNKKVEEREETPDRQIKLAKRSYGRMDMTQHITNNPVILKEVNDKQRNSPLKKNQKFIITDKRSSMSYKGNQPGESNFHTGTIMTLDNNTGDVPLFRMHNCQLVQRFNVTYEQTSKLYAGTNVNPANMISVEDAVFHRFRDTTFVYDQNISLDIRYRYSLIKNTIFLRVIEI